LNIQTERREDHTALLTVEVGSDRFNKAKKQAAKKLSKQYRIPGFRKGKAPYNVMVRYIGEAPIIEEAMENLGNQVYKDALDESDVEPYGPGSLEDFKLEPEPTYIFSVPLQPEITLNDYRETRLDYEAPTVSDDDVNESLRQMQQQHAESAESDEPVASGNRITVDIESEFADGEDRPEDDSEEVEESDVEEDDETTENEIPFKGDPYIHRNATKLHLDPENEPLLPGFIEAMVGANVGDTVEFELDVPEDSDFEDIRGRKVHFSVTLNEVETVDLPELNDEFANKATEEEDEPLNLEQLTTRIRENLEENAVRQAENTYASEILDMIVEASEVNFPQAMVDERIEEMLQDLDGNLRQQGIGLEEYMNITGATREQLGAQYQPEAVSSVKRSLVLGEILNSEKVIVNNDDVEAEIDTMLSQFGEQADAFRQFLDTPQQRQSIMNNLLYTSVMDRLAKIGRGESLEEIDETLEDAVVEEATTEETADTDAETDDVTPDESSNGDTDVADDETPPTDDIATTDADATDGADK